MPTLDIMNDDAFSVSNLTLAINETPYVPGRISSQGLFNEEGINTTTVQIEKKGEVLSLVPDAPRGAPGVIATRDKRTMIPFNCTHLPQNDAILADSIQNVRAFGAESELESVQTVVNRQLAKMRRDTDATIEWQRIGALKGQILDADGSTVLLDLFTAFGVSQQTLNMALDTGTTKVRVKALAAKRLVEDALGGAMYKGLRAFCGKDFFDALIDHANVKAAYERWLDGEALRNDPRAGFSFAGITWEEYRGSVGGNDFVADGEAHLVPEGVSDLFITRFAPADYMETVNTNGLPYYAKQEVMRMDKGVEVETQSNPLNICSRPRSVIKLTQS